ncbi:hypothetical protein [Aureimonas sp. AU12]|uniref:hypothetical protein n=1 Tax=Aureimonas sp. AU12 TaxID=1638161 RepID=UPI000785F026|nr:hypothetical protein [Aureimonas sp. AU12]
MDEPASWRAMTVADLPAVMAIADRVHPAFPEGEATILDRLALFPQGCLVLEAVGRSGPSGIGGYAIAYPAPLFAPPPLDTVLGTLPALADSLYVHDVALLPDWRGGGRSDAGIRLLLDLADAFPAAMLVSVYGTAPFWGRYGFVPNADPRLGDKLATYGEGAVFMVRERASSRPDGAKFATV